MKKSYFFLLIALLLVAEGIFAQAEISLISHLPHQDTVSRGTDIWALELEVGGETHEYGLLGTFTSVSVIDLADPVNPKYIAYLPQVKGFDIKTYQHYAYCAGGNGRSGLMNILDLQDPYHPQVVGQIANAHNIWIDDNGYLYAAHVGLKIYDLKPDPTRPQLIWQDTTLGGHDIAVFGNRIFFFEGYNGTFIYDAPDRSNPQLIAQITDPNIQYHHSGWLRGQYLYICDELAKSPTADITVWDISDIDNPTKVGEYEDGQSIVHNIYVKGSTAFVSYYKRGLRVFDIQKPAEMELLATYDTYGGPLDETFDGAFGVYPFSPNGYFLVNDMSNGFFLFDIQYAPKQNMPLTAFPNPFTQSIRLVVETEGQPCKLEVFDSEGRLIAIPFEGTLNPGVRWLAWDGNVGESGTPAKPGAYYLRYTEGPFEDAPRQRGITVIKQP